MCARTAWIDETDALPLDAAEDRLSSVHGIGPWSVAEVARIALGDADAVSVGDFHVPNIVAWALAREPRGSDERMLELLETSGIRAPAFGPRMAPRAIDRI